MLDKTGILDPQVMHPLFPPAQRRGTLADGGDGARCREKRRWRRRASSPEDIDLVICAASKHGARLIPRWRSRSRTCWGSTVFAFDMNVACSSATFGIQAAADMVRAGSIRAALVVNPEICSGHLEWRDRDCHFIFGDVATACVIERMEEAKGPLVRDPFRPAARRSFSNNIRNNNGFLRRTRPDGVADRRDMQFMQNGRKVFKEVVSDGQPAYRRTHGPRPASRAAR